MFSDEKKFICMDTTVLIKILSQQKTDKVDQAIDEAARFFYKIERTCSRFDPDSELMRLSRRTGESVGVSPLLYQAVKFAVETARETDGAFDPSIGRSMEQRGFDRNYLSGKTVRSTFADSEKTSYKDLLLDGKRRKILLKKPMVIDLNAVVKGMAVDVAAKAVRNKGFVHFIINAGGDVYAAGLNEQERPWKIGIRNPVRRSEQIGSIRLSDAAICTSGDYERPSKVLPGQNHLLDPHKDRSPGNIASCSVIAPFAMLADAFSTASFIMGSNRGLKKMEEMHLDCVMVTRSQDVRATNKFKEKWSWNE